MNNESVFGVQVRERNAGWMKTRFLNTRCGRRRPRSCDIIRITYARCEWDGNKVEENRQSITTTCCPPPTPPPTSKSQPKPYSNFKPPLKKLKGILQHPYDHLYINYSPLEVLKRNLVLMTKCVFQIFVIVIERRCTCLGSSEPPTGSMTLGLHSWSVFGYIFAPIYLNSSWLYCTLIYTWSFCGWSLNGPMKKWGPATPSLSLTRAY